MSKPIDAFYTVANVPTAGLTVTINIYKRNGTQTVVDTGTMEDDGGGHYHYMTNLDDGEHKFTLDGGVGITNLLERYKWGLVGS